MICKIKNTVARTVGRSVSGSTFLSVSVSRYGSITKVRRRLALSRVDSSGGRIVALGGLSMDGGA